MSTIEASATAIAEEMLSLSVVMPVHNEARTIRAAVEEVLSLDVNWTFELIVVDDGSTDSTPLELAALEAEGAPIRVFRHPLNLGKGAAVLTGAHVATGSHLVVFDADLEYRAADLARMFETIRAGTASVVFGKRDFRDNTVFHPVSYTLGRRFTTAAANLMYGSSLSDLHTCLKMLPTRLFRQLDLSERGFGLDSEITAELLRRGYQPTEVPVAYVGRSHADGKKIRWTDGVECLKVLAKVRLRGIDPPVIDLDPALQPEVGTALAL